MKWNEVIYKDCMNEVNGLPTLEDKSVDLCLTDPPYNINFTTKKNKGVKYMDSLDDYPIFIEKIFNEIFRVCKRVMVSIGYQNLKLWYNLYDPIAPYYFVKTNGAFGGRISVWNNMEIYLYFGPTKKPYPFKSNVFHGSVATGFNKNRLTSDKVFVHPCPRFLGVWEHIIKSFCPISVIDPFMGSGTTAEVCTKLGIPWLGYELNEVYSQDIEKRLHNIKKEPKQVGLDMY